MLPPVFAKKKKNNKDKACRNEIAQQVEQIDGWPYSDKIIWFHFASLITLSYTITLTPAPFELPFIVQDAST